MQEYEKDPFRKLETPTDLKLKETLNSQKPNVCIKVKQLETKIIASENRVLPKSI